MNCYEFEISVLALARNQLMDAMAYAEGMTHAADCVRCAGRLAAERMLLAGIAEVKSEVATENAPARVEAAVLAAFHEEVLAPAETVVQPARAQAVNWPHWRRAAIAAVIVIVASGLAIFWSQANSTSQKSETVSTSPSTSGPPAPRPLPQQEEINHEYNSGTYLAGDSAAKKMRPAASRGKREVAEVVTEFYPVVDGEDLDSLEAVQILRVELPASALTDAGLELGPDGSDGSVKADVVLGHDGMARAIRFIR